MNWAQCEWTDYSRNQGNVTVTQKWYVIRDHPKMHP